MKRVPVSPVELDRRKRSSLRHVAVQLHLLGTDIVVDVGGFLSQTIFDFNLEFGKQEMENLSGSVFLSS